MAELLSSVRSRTAPTCGNTAYNLPGPGYTGLHAKHAEKLKRCPLGNKFQDERQRSDEIALTIALCNFG